jgi:hypothetical protein
VSAWEEFGNPGFAERVQAIRSAMAEGRADELRARRRTGLRAYERAMGAGETQRGQIRNSFLLSLGLADDDI